MIPPHILRSLAVHGTPAQRRRAERALQLSDYIRARREIVAGRFVSQRRSMWAGVPAAPPTRTSSTVYDAHGTPTQPGTRVRGDADPASADVAVNEAYDGAASTLTLYRAHFGRESLDGHGFPLVSTVHYDDDGASPGYDNAFWDGEQMVYGDGDGELFTRFTAAVDVIGHELSHGVCQWTAAFQYQDQAGALNEANSDVLGSLVKQASLHQTADQADWLIGAGLFTPAVRGVALRSMRAPGTAYDDPVLGVDPQPAHMRDYVTTWDDNGGVHINSGIPNRAFYLLATNLGGYAWERAGRIWYDALLGEWRASTDFQGAADGLYRAAVTRYGEGSVEAKAVIDALGQVGLATGPSVPKPNPTPRHPCRALVRAVQAAWPHLADAFGEEA